MNAAQLQRRRPLWRPEFRHLLRYVMQQRDQKTELIQRMEALRNRLDAIDVANVGITQGIRRHTLGPDAVYQLLDLIAVDLKARTDVMMGLLT